MEIVYKNEGRKIQTHDMEATLRMVIRLLSSESRTVNRNHSLSGTEEAYLDEEQEEQRNPDIIAV